MTSTPDTQISKDEDTASYEEGFEDGMSQVANEALYYLADTKRKTIPYEWIKKYQKDIIPLTSKEGK